MHEVVWLIMAKAFRYIYDVRYGPDSRIIWGEQMPVRWIFRPLSAKVSLLTIRLLGSWSFRRMHEVTWLITAKAFRARHFKWFPHSTNVVRGYGAEASERDYSDLWQCSPYLGLERLPEMGRRTLPKHLRMKQTDFHRTP